MDNDYTYTTPADQLAIGGGYADQANQYTYTGVGNANAIPTAWCYGDRHVYECKHEVYCLCGRTQRVPPVDGL